MQLIFFNKLKKKSSIKSRIYDKMELIEAGDKEALIEVKNAAELMLSGMRLSLKRLNAEADSYFHESDLILDSTDFGKSEILINENWNEGIGSSLRTAIMYLENFKEFDNLFLFLAILLLVKQ